MCISFVSEDILSFVLLMYDMYDVITFVMSAIDYSTRLQMTLWYSSLSMNACTKCMKAIWRCVSVTISFAISISMNVNDETGNVLLVDHFANWLFCIGVNLMYLVQIVLYQGCVHSQSSSVTFNGLQIFLGIRVLT